MPSECKLSNRDQIQFYTSTVVQFKTFDVPFFHSYASSALRSHNRLEKRGNCFKRVLSSHSVLDRPRLWIRLGFFVSIFFFERTSLTNCILWSTAGWSLILYNGFRDVSFLSLGKYIRETGLTETISTSYWKSDTVVSAMGLTINFGWIQFPLFPAISS